MDLFKKTLMMKIFTAAPRRRDYKDDYRDDRRYVFDWLICKLRCYKLMSRFVC
jgi:hypothetical protein